MRKTNTLEWFDYICLSTFWGYRRGFKLYNFFWMKLEGKKEKDCWRNGCVHTWNLIILQYKRGQQFLSLLRHHRVLKGYFCQRNIPSRIFLMFIWVNNHCYSFRTWKDSEMYLHCLVASDVHWWHSLYNPKWFSMC